MNEISIFKYEGSDVRTVLRGGEPWWVLKDVCDVLGIDNPSYVRNRLDDDEVGSFDLPHPQSSAKALEMVCVNESGLYRIVLRSDKPEAKRFQRWVTHEVLPAIRKHRVYAPDELLANPDFLIKALQDLKAEREKNRALTSVVGTQNKQIAELTPKAGYYDVVLACKDAVAITTIAKDYGKSGIWLNKLLHTLGVQFKQGDIWLLYQEYAENGYTRSRTIPYIGLEGERHSKVHTYWTQAGRLFIYALLKEHNILPLVEQRMQRGAR